MAIMAIAPFYRPLSAETALRQPKVILLPLSLHKVIFFNYSFKKMQPIY